MISKYTIEDFVEELETGFSTIRGDVDAVKGFTGLIRKSLRKYDGYMLKDAAEDMIRNRKSKSFPALAEILDFCQRAYNRSEASKARHLPIDGAPKPGEACKAYENGEKRYKMLMESRPDVAVQAAKEGMGGVLKAFVIRKGRLPNSPDEKIEWFSGEDPCSIRQEYRKFIEAYESCVKKEAEGPKKDGSDDNIGAWQKLGNFTQWGSLRRLGDAMFDKEKARAEWILRAK